MNMFEVQRDREWFESKVGDFRAFVDELNARKASRKTMKTVSLNVDFPSPKEGRVPECEIIDSLYSSKAASSASTSSAAAAAASGAASTRSIEHCWQSLPGYTP